MLPQFWKQIKPAGRENFVNIIDRFCSLDELTWSRKYQCAIKACRSKGHKQITWMIIEFETSRISYLPSSELFNSDSLLEEEFDEYSFRVS